MNRYSTRHVGKHPPSIDSEPTLLPTLTPPAEPHGIRLYIAFSNILLVMLLLVPEAESSWTGDRALPAAISWQLNLAQADTQRRAAQTEIDRLLKAIEDERKAIEREEREEREAAEEARRRADEQTQEAIQRAEQAAEDVRKEMLRSAVRTKNTFYSTGTLLIAGGFATYIAMRARGRAYMEENEKYGIMTIIISAFLIVLALMLSDDWVPQWDYLENLMNRLRIRLVEFEEIRPCTPRHPDACGGVHLTYLIDVPTKYIVLSLLGVAAYGFTTYLGITRAFRPWRKIFT